MLLALFALITTLKFTKDGKETWVFVDATSAGQTGYRVELVKK